MQRHHHHHQCATCGDTINPTTTEGKEEPAKASFGGKECIQCRKDSVVQNCDVQSLFTNELVHFFNHVLGLPLDDWHIKVTLCEQHELRVAPSAGTVDSVHTGECISSVSVHHVRSLQTNAMEDLIHTRRVQEIRLLKGMHIELVARTICHEAMHGWIALWHGQPCGTTKCAVCPTKLSDTVAEGLCEFAAWRFLEHRQQKLHPASHRFKVIENTKARMLSNTSGVYAKGLRLARAAFVSKGNCLKRSKNAAFFKSVFALSAFPQGEGKVSTPVKGGDEYNGEISTSLGSCGFCQIEIEPSSTTEFEFVVLGSEKTGRSGRSGHGSGRRTRAGLTSSSCVCLPCYEESRPKCKWCDQPLHTKPTVKDQNLHRECFIAYEKEFGDKCYVCNEILWEVESKTETEKRGSFVRRTSYTSASSPAPSLPSSSERTRTAHNNTRREVHVRCGDRCTHCQKLFVNEKFITANANDKLHDHCFNAHQLKTGMVCGTCHKPLWSQGKTGSYERRTRMVKGVEIHVECGPVSLNL